MTERENAIFSRTERLVGTQGMIAITSKNVAIFGVGGVGSWCAESLVRSGIRRLTIVDSDRICPSNINRQSMATTQTIGMVKVEALKQRLLAINPDAQITAIQEIYCHDTAAQFKLDDYDFVVDAIDSLKDKAALILHATRSKCTLVSSMGAALKISPTAISVAEFWKVDGCPLARALRKKFRHVKDYPARKFLCVYSAQVLTNLGDPKDYYDMPHTGHHSEHHLGRIDLADHQWNSSKAQINGSMAHTTAIFGFTIAGVIMESILKPIK